MNKEDFVAEKIELLEDFCVLPKRAYRQRREVEDILMNCKDEFEMQRKIRDVIVGNKTIKEFINQYGGVLC